MERYESISNWFRLKDDGDVSLLLKQISLANEFIRKLKDDLDRVEFVVNSALDGDEDLFISLESVFKNNKLLFRIKSNYNFLEWIDESFKEVIDGNCDEGCYQMDCDRGGCFRCMDEIDFHNFFKKHLHSGTNLIFKVFDREEFEIREEIIYPEK